MAPPRILLANDDGIQAAGLQSLVHALSRFADVWIVAPDREQSATSHSISLHKPLRARRVGPQSFAVDGTPTDCVYLGLNHFLKEPPDMVVSGINHGPNLGNDVIYSGTVSAAMEGALFGHPAIAVSLCLPDNYRERGFLPEDFVVAAEFASELVQTTLARPMPVGTLLNVNIPFRPRHEIRGFRLCRLGYTDWADMVTVRDDPRGKPYYWIGGQRGGTKIIDGSDIDAVDQGLISMTPIHYDVTDCRSFAYTRGLEVRGFDRRDDKLGDKPLPHPAHPKGRRQ